MLFIERSVQFEESSSTPLDTFTTINLESLYHDDSFLEVHNTSSNDEESSSSTSNDDSDHEDAHSSSSEDDDSPPNSPSPVIGPF